MAIPTQKTDQSLHETLEELERLKQATRASRDPELARRILDVRHRAGCMLTKEAIDAPTYPEPAFDQLPPRPGVGLPEFGPSDLRPALLRAAILRDGCLLVRGLIDRDDAVALADEIERAFTARDRAAASNGAPDDGASLDGYYDRFLPAPQFRQSMVARGWVEQGGGVLAADSPRVACDMFETFENAGLLQTIGGYLGERPAVSVHKCTLRKAEPGINGSWHQDGTFMGEVRSVNVWLALSRCGDVAPGMDLVPRRLESFAPTDGDRTSIEVSHRTAVAAAGEFGLLRPIFEPGDALLFDDLFLHRTAAEDTQKPRYAIESWFFGPSAFPDTYAPLIF